MKNIMNEKLSVSKTNPIRARHIDYDRFFYPWHFHSEYEIMYIRESTGQRFVGDSIEPFRDGDIILMGSNLPHYMKSGPAYDLGNEELRVKGTVIQFEKDFMAHSISNYPQFNQIKLLLDNSQRGIYFPAHDSKEIVKLAEMVPDATGVEQITTLLLLLQKMSASKHKRYLASPNYFDTLSSLASVRIERIVSYLNRNYTRNIDLREISSLAAMNPAAFCRYFKEKTGKTFKEYVLDMRIGYACKLLTVGSMNISQISGECGFESITHFNRIFKRSTGFTPTAYRLSITA